MKRKEQVQRICWLCGRNGNTDPLDEHHIFGGANRKLSDKYGLKVYLCHNRCHENGPKSAHRNAETAERLHKYGQRKAMKEQGWTIDDFRTIFGRNYLDEDEAVFDEPVSGPAFVPLEDYA